MAKNGVFKKITALAMAIALVVCFAVSASATVSVNTTTKYVGQEIEVNVSVTADAGEITEGTNVTYYATKNGANVHIDQTTATASGATFKFNVDGDAQLNSDVVIGYTGASAAETGNKITGYTVTCTKCDSKVIPTDANSVSFTYTPANNMDVDQINVTGYVTGAEGRYENGTILVTFTKATGDFAVEVTEKSAVVESAAEAYFIGSGGVLSTGKNDQILAEGTGEEDAKGNVLNGTLVDDESETTGARKITVMGTVDNVGAEAEYGVIITIADITEGDMSAADFAAKYTDCKYEGLTKASTTGLFAVQVVDTSAEAEGFIRTGVRYNTAVYAQDADGNYTVTEGDPVTIAAAETTN